MAMQDTTTTQLGGPQHSRPAHKGERCAGEQSAGERREGVSGLAAEVCHDTIVCIVTRGGGLASRHNEPRAMIRLSSAPRYGVRHATRRMAGACVAIRYLYRYRRAHDTTACAGDTTSDMANARCDTTYDTIEHGHDTTPVRTTTRRCAQPRPWVYALCTRSSFDSVHYFELLFGSLFMNTVHEVLKK